METRNSLQNLLQLAKQGVGDLDGVESCCVVIGNTSCDLDSVASTLALADYRMLLHTSSLSLPVLHCSRPDLATRKDTLWLLKQLDIDSSDLLVLDDITLSSLPSLSISLVDHNSPSPSLQPHIHCVTECIDHHHDDGLLSQCDNVMIEPVASCSTLVAQKLKEAEDYDIPNDVATILLAAILVDTVNLTIDKTTDKDRAMAAYLQGLSIITAENMYDQLENARWNQDGLSLQEVLSADTKTQTSRAGGEGEGVCVAMFCTIRCLYEALVTKYESLDSGLQEFCSTHGVHMLVLVMMDRGPPFRRQTALFESADLPHSQRDMAEYIATRLEGDEELGMERVTGTEFGGILFNQKNTLVSRKQLIPLIMDYLEDGDLSPPTSAPPQVKVNMADKENDSETQHSESREGSLVHLESISARLGESMDSFALAQDSDGSRGSRTSSSLLDEGSGLTGDPLVEEDEVEREDDRIMLETANRTWPDHPLEPAVTVLSSSDDNPPAVLPTPQAASHDPIPEYTWEEEHQAARTFRTIEIAGEEHRISLKLIEPYRNIVQHGGYVGREQTAIVVLSACYLPPKSLVNYPQVITQLFFYVLSVVDRLVVDDYVIIYLHSGAPRNSMPGIQLFHKFYKMIDRRLRKNLKHLYIVHPSFWVKAMLRLARPFISGKFYRKVHFVMSLSQLQNSVPLESHYIPKIVTSTDQQLNPDDYKPKTTST